MPGGFRRATLPGNLQLNPAASRILGSSYGAGPFRIARALPDYSSEQLIQEPALQIAVGPDSPSLQPDLNALAPMVPAVLAPGAVVRDELKYAKFINVPLSIGLASVRVLLKPASGARRVYLFISNTHGAQNLFIAFGQDSSATIGVPIPFGNGSFEWNNVIPQDDVFLIANGAGTTGVLLYANDTLAGAPA